LITGQILLESGSERGFVYDSNTQAFTVIGLLPGVNATISSFASAINSSGVVVGQCAGHGISFSGGILTDLEPLVNPSDSGSAGDINDAGHIAATRRNVNGSQPVLYDLRNPNAEFVDIGLPSGFVSGGALAINNSGDVVGTCLRSDDSQSIFIASGRKAADLSTLIPPNSRWVLTEVPDINDAGYIVGESLLNGNPAVYLLRPNLVPRGLGVFGMILTVSLGVMEDGGGPVFLNGRPIPVGPWGALTAFQQDVMLGLATEEQAQLINDKVAQSAIRQAALELVKTRISEALKSLRGKLRVSVGLKRLAKTGVG
jgi:hypothetical protein